MTRCKQCGDPIRWIKTQRGKWMMLQVDDYEPHYPHCGKSKWTEDDWKAYRERIAIQTVRNNRKTKANRYLLTNPKSRKCFYSGVRPPWDFLIFIECYE